MSPFVSFSSTSVDDLPPSEAWQEIESVFNELAGLARSDAGPEEFQGRVLERLVGLLAAVGGAVWRIGPDRRASVLCQLHLDQSLAGDSHELTRHQRLAEAAAKGDQPLVVPPAYRDGQLANASPWLAILCPAIVEGQALIVIEVFQRPDGRTAIVQGYSRIVRTACDLVEEYHRRRALGESRTQQDELRSLLEYANHIHEQLDLATCTTVIANEARRVVGCDRAAVLSCRGNRPRVEAISGVESFDRRSGVVRSLETLARAVLAGGDPFWFPDQCEELPSQMAGQVQAYLDESHVRGTGLLPLRTGSNQEGEAVGMLCVEQFGAPFDEALRRRAMAVAQASVPALANARDYDRIPLRTVLQWVATMLGWRSGRRWSPALVAGAVVGAVAVALCLIPAELTIESRGQLMPQRRQHVFAPSDSTVVELIRGDGQIVEKGELLVQLQSPALDIQQSELIGKQRTVQEDLLATETEALRSETEGGADRSRRQSTARALQLKEELRGLEAQLEVLRQQRAQLEVKSPIAGMVITWDAERQLAGRPVKRGESLLTVADLAGAWELVLDVSDRRAGHVLAARKAARELAVTYQLGTDPGTVRRGSLKTISPATELSPDKEPTVRMTAALTDVPPGQFRPGATAVARIDCGQRSLAYVWLHELWEAIRMRMFL